MHAVTAAKRIPLGHGHQTTTRAVAISGATGKMVRPAMYDSAVCRRASHSKVRTNRSTLQARSTSRSITQTAPASSNHVAAWRRS
jgi:hypothetical protein